MKKNTPSRNFVILLLFILSSGITHLHAQTTTLAAGDISIIGFNSSLSNRDGFAFVTWVDLANGAVIKFTDDGFNNTASATSSSNIRDLEQTVTWTATSIRR